MAYEKVNWQNGVTPLSDDNFNHMDQGIYDAFEEIKGVVPSSNILLVEDVVTPSSGGGATADYYKDISDLIDDIDDWMVISVGTKTEGATYDSWHFGTRTTYTINQYVTAVNAYNYAFLSVENSQRRIRYRVSNPNANGGTKKVYVRILLYKIA